MSLLISISFCTLSSVTFTISLLTFPNTSVLISISFWTLSSVTFTISVQKEIDINTEVLGITNSEIVKVTDESVQKEVYILCSKGVIASEIISHFILIISVSFATRTLRPSVILNILTSFILVWCSTDWATRATWTY
jgi:hypothetical protein